MVKGYTKPVSLRGLLTALRFPQSLLIATQVSGSQSKGQPTDACMLPFPLSLIGTQVRLFRSGGKKVI